VSAIVYFGMAGRLILLFVLPFAVWFGLELLVPLSMVVTGPLFFPFIAHPFKINPGIWSEALYAREPWSYFSNGGFVAVVAAFTVMLGRRLALWTNVAVFFGLLVAASFGVHLTLAALGFPYRVDGP